MTDRRIFLLAAGGHGAVVLDALLECGRHVTAIVDPGRRIGDAVFDVNVIGGDECMDAIRCDDVYLANGIGVTPGSTQRRQRFETFRERGFAFVSILHPSATIGRDVELLEGSQIMAGSVLQCRVQVGENAVINTRVTVDHDGKVGPHAFIGPGAVLCGGVAVAEGAFVGAGAVLLPGIQVAAGAIVAAGAVVTRNVRGGVVVAGNPAAEKQ